MCETNHKFFINCSIPRGAKTEVIKNSSEATLSSKNFLSYRLNTTEANATSSVGNFEHQT